MRRNSRQLAKTSYFTYPYIVACGLKNFRDFKSKRNVDLFVVLSALRLDLRCLRSGEKRFVKHLLGELLLGLRYFQNTEVRKTDISSGELLLDLRCLRNYSRIKGEDVIGELLLGLPYLRNKDIVILHLNNGELLLSLRYLRNTPTSSFQSRPGELLLGLPYLRNEKVPKSF